MTLYGPLATLIGLMMWFYLTAYAVLLGAELNAALDHQWRLAAKPATAEETETEPQGIFHLTALFRVEVPALKTEPKVAGRLFFDIG